MKDTTMKLIQERKQLKQNGITTEKLLLKYQQLNKEIQRYSRKDKNEYLEKICTEIEEHQITNNSKDLFRKINQITREFRPKTWTIDNEDGKTLHDIDEIFNRWEEYCKRLFKEDKVATTLSNLSEVNTTQHNKNQT